MSSKISIILVSCCFFRMFNYKNVKLIDSEIMVFQRGFNL